MEYKLNVEGKELKLSSGEVEKLDIIKKSEGRYQMVEDLKNYDIELVEYRATDRTVVLTVNGTAHTIEIQDELDQLVSDLGMEAVAEVAESDIKAPMPGLIVDIMVKPGDPVEEGTVLFILEAMKMENMIKASGPGEVKAVSASKGDSVEKNQVIIELA